MPSTSQRAAIDAITLARNYIQYGSATAGAATERLEELAPDGSLVSGPLALLSAVEVVGWQAQYEQARGYILRALINSQISYASPNAPAASQIPQTLAGR
jgi:hypothetical protein